MQEKVCKAEHSGVLSGAAKEREIGKCPNCGGKMKDSGQEFVCPYCGTRTAKADAEIAGASPAAQAEASANVRKAKRRKLFSASGIAKLAMLTALAFAVSYLEFPIFPAAPFLQMDFSLVFVLLGGFLYGPVASIIISAIKECLRLFTTSTGGVGEIANFLVTFCFVIVPTLVYRFKKGLPVVVLTLAIGCILEVGAGLLTNRYINFPLFMGEGAVAQFELLWWYVLLFNLIKSVAVSLVTVLLYKRISWLFNKF